MAKLTVAVMYMGWLVVFPACASSDEIPRCWERDEAASSNQVMPLCSSLFLPTLGAIQLKPRAEGPTASRYAVAADLPGRNEWPKRDFKSSRLSFTPVPNWTFRLSRGVINGLDQLIPNEDVRRTSISAIYTHNFNLAHWQTTVGWGRYTRKSREAMVGYLLESTLRFHGGHSMFGRLEQVGSDDLMRTNESLQRHLFRIKKLTLGYFQNVQPNASFGFDIGGMVSRHFIPADMTPSYGRRPISYMMFVRLKFQ